MEIYNDVYGELVTDEIKENRKQFIRDYQIIKEGYDYDYSFNKKNKELIYDHFRSYITSDKKNIYIVSLYHIKNEQLWIEDGWLKIYPLYTNNSTTLIKMIEVQLILDDINKRNKPWIRIPSKDYPDCRDEDLFLCHHCKKYYPYYDFDLGINIESHGKNDVYRLMNNEDDRGGRVWACNNCITNTLFNDKLIQIWDENGKMVNMKNAYKF